MARRGVCWLDRAGVVLSVVVPMVPCKTCLTYGPNMQFLNPIEISREIDPREDGN